MILFIARYPRVPSYVPTPVPLIVMRHASYEVPLLQRQVLGRGHLNLELDLLPHPPTRAVSATSHELFP